MGFRSIAAAAVVVALLALGGCQGCSYHAAYHARQVAQHGSAEAAFDASIRAAAAAVRAQSAALQQWSAAEAEETALRLVHAAGADIRRARRASAEARQRYEDSARRADGAVHMADAVHAQSGWGRLPAPPPRAAECEAIERRSHFADFERWAAVCAASLDFEAQHYAPAAR